MNKWQGSGNFRATTLAMAGLIDNVVFPFVSFAAHNTPVGSDHRQTRHQPNCGGHLGRPCELCAHFVGARRRQAGQNARRNNPSRCRRKAGDPRLVDLNDARRTTNRRIFVVYFTEQRGCTPTPIILRENGNMHANRTKLMLTVVLLI